MIVDLNPILLHLGPFTVRWYGFLMALSIALGFYFFRRGGLRLGYSEDFLYNLVFISVIGGIAGARFIYVATNWSAFVGNWWSMIRIDEGGLSFHGGLLGGAVFGGAYLLRRGASFAELADLAVPGLAIGIVLVRIGNLFNQEVLGRLTSAGAAFGMPRHPAQLYGSAIGITLLLIHNFVTRRRPRPPAGYLFWTFLWWYSLLRGLVEETFRDNPLYAWGYVNATWGMGFFTLTQLVTPFLLVLAWWMRRESAARPVLSRRPRP